MGKKRRKSLLTLGNRIGRLRRERDLSLEELARQTGLSEAYLTDVEEGREMPPVGENQYRLRQGKSAHFNSSIPHVLRNPGAEKTELIVVLYIP